MKLLEESEKVQKPEKCRSFQRVLGKRTRRIPRGQDQKEA
jgi:hypothetical protein